MTRRKNESSQPQAVATPTPADDDSLNLRPKVDELSCEVERQCNIINLLTQRLSFMLSVFGIEDGVLHRVHNIIIIIIIHTFLYRRKVVTSEAVAEVVRSRVNHCLSL